MNAKRSHWGGVFEFAFVFEFVFEKVVFEDEGEGSGEGMLALFVWMREERVVR